MSHECNVTENNFTFPNTTESDRFNITIRAYGVAGYGNPLILNSDKWKNLPIKDSQSNSNRNSSSLYVIFIIAITSIAILAFAAGYVLCRRDRYCKQNGIINSSEQSSFQPPTSPLVANMRMDEMYEMQNLIPTSQTIMTNGKDVTTAIKIENTSNGGLNILEHQKILRTSTPTEDDINQICIERPTRKHNEISPFQFDDVVKPSTKIDFASGVIDLNFTPQNSITTEAILENASASTSIRDPKFNVTSKVGNSSPYKSLQVSPKINNL